MPINQFPYVKKLANLPILIIAFNSSVPTWPFVSRGTITEQMIQQATTQLQNYDQTFFKVVVLHHPPVIRNKTKLEEFLHGMTPQDKERVVKFCKDHQVQLLLNGHTHRPFCQYLPGTKTLNVEAGSSTYISQSIPNTSRYNIYHVEENELVKVERRIWQNREQQFVTEEIKI